MRKLTPQQSTSCDHKQTSKSLRYFVHRQSVQSGILPIVKNSGVAALTNPFPVNELCLDTGLPFSCTNLMEAMEKQCVSANLEIATSKSRLSGSAVWE